MQDLIDFLQPVIMHELNEDNGYTDGQFAKHIAIYETEIPNLEGIDIVLVGTGEMRGSGVFVGESNAADMIREQLYQLHYWHTDVSIADIGNIRTGNSLSDSYAAVKTVLAELLKIILSH